MNASWAEPAGTRVLAFHFRCVPVDERQFGDGADVANWGGLPGWLDRRRATSGSGRPANRRSSLPPPGTQERRNDGPPCAQRSGVLQFHLSELRNARTAPVPEVPLPVGAGALARHPSSARYRRRRAPYRRDRGMAGSGALDSVRQERGKSTAGVVARGRPGRGVLSVCVHPAPNGQNCLLLLVRSPPAGRPSRPRR
jgi:hypothetical protein